MGTGQDQLVPACASKVKVFSLVPAALLYLPLSLFLFSVTPGKWPFRASPQAPSGPLGGCTSAGVVEREPPLTHPAGTSHSSGSGGSLSLGACGLQCPVYLPWCDRSYRLQGKKPLGANSRGPSYCPPYMGPLDSSLLVPEILGGFSHSAGGSSLAL